MRKTKRRLSKVLAPTFYPLHRAVKTGEAIHFWLPGGRGSGKSSAVSVEILLGIMEHPDANGVVLRKVGKNLKDSVYQQLLWAAGKLGVRELWEARVSPQPVMIYKPTGQKILFRGMDSPQKLRSVKTERGYVRYIWFEEADEFSGEGELRSVMQSLMRGGEKFAVFYTFNPPRSSGHWINRAAASEGCREDARVIRSDYREMPEEWLGEPFLAEAERLREKDPKAYAHEYLGQAVGTGGEVFPNLKLRKIEDGEIAGFCRVRRGIDWGYGADPFVYLAAEVDRKRKRVLVFHEEYRFRARFDWIAGAIRAENPGGEAVMADSAEPRSNDELRERGIRVLAAKKGPGSIEHGISWLQDLEELVIDPERCPNAAREFAEYTLEEDGCGGFAGGFPDRNNHCIDALRYACEREMRRTGVGF